MLFSDKLRGYWQVLVPEQLEMLLVLLQAL
jgi:hypothetical protein